MGELTWHTQYAWREKTTLLHYTQLGGEGFEIYEDDSFLMLFPRAMGLPCEVFRTLDAAKLRAEAVMAQENKPTLIWMVRWHIARFMVHVAIKVAPKGAARDLLVSYLNAYGREVMQTIDAARDKP